MWINKIPLRFSIPVGILAFNLILLVIDLQTDMKTTIRQTVQSAREDLEKSGMLLSMQVESSLRNENVLEARDKISAFTAIEEQIRVYLIDSVQQIILSDQSHLEGKKLEHLQDYLSIDAIGSDTMQYGFETIYDQTDRLLINYNQVFISIDDKHYIPGSIGHLVITKDLNNVLIKAEQNRWSKVWIDVGIYILFSLCLWLLFHYLFIRRINAIIAGFQKPAKLHPEIYNGRDEISSLGKVLSQIHERLAQSLSRYQTILNTSNVAIAELNPAGVYTYINQTWENMFGYTARQVIGKEFFFNFHPNEKESSMLENISNGRMKSYSQKCQFLTENGESKWCELYIGANKNNESVVSIIALMFDISDLINAQEELRKQNTFISTILDNIPLGIAVNRFNEGKATYINNAFEKIYGWPGSKLKDVESFFSNVYPDKTYREAIQKRTMKDIQSRDPGRMHWENIQITTQTGKKRIINAQNIPLFEQNLMISTVQDVTEKKKYEIRIKQSEEKFSTIFKNSPDAILVTRFKDGKIIDLNNATTDILGYTYGELVGKKTTKFQLWSDNNDRIKYVNYLEKKGRISGFEADFIVKKGEVRTCSISGEIIHLADEKHILNILHDVTEIKKVQDALWQSKQQLKNITDNIPGAIMQYQISPDGTDKLLYVSEGAENIWGISPDEAIQNMENVWEKVEKEDIQMLKESIAKSYREMSPWQVEFRNNLPDGAQKWTMGVGIPKKMNDNSVVWDSLLLDITDRKTAELQLLEYQESLKKLSTELAVSEEIQRKEIATKIHDHLSQSLVISKMKINDLIKEQNLQPYLASLKFIKNHISEAIENSRRITYDLSPPMLYELGLIETLYWLAEKTENENNLKVDVITEIDQLNLPESTMILLYHSIQEILFNVIKHAEASNVDIQLNLKHEELVINIRDNGKGFKVPDNWSKWSTKGFGLFAVRERIKNLGGQFSIQSVPDEGTNVKIKLSAQSNSSTNGN